MACINSGQAAMINCKICCCPMAAPMETNDLNCSTIRTMAGKDANLSCKKRLNALVSLKIGSNYSQLANNTLLANHK